MPRSVRSGGSVPRGRLRRRRSEHGGSQQGGRHSETQRPSRWDMFFRRGPPPPTSEQNMAVSIQEYRTQQAAPLELQPSSDGRTLLPEGTVLCPPPSLTQFSWKPTLLDLAATATIGCLTSDTRTATNWIKGLLAFKAIDWLESVLPTDKPETLSNRLSQMPSTLWKYTSQMRKTAADTSFSEAMPTIYRGAAAATALYYGHTAPTALAFSSLVGGIADWSADLQKDQLTHRLANANTMRRARPGKEVI